jgi:hypothetical protein
VHVRDDAGDNGTGHLPYQARHLGRYRFPVIGVHSARLGMAERDGRGRDLGFPRERVEHRQGGLIDGFGRLICLRRAEPDPNPGAAPDSVHRHYAAQPHCPSRQSGGCFSGELDVPLGAGDDIDAPQAWPGSASCGGYCWP